MKHENLKEKYMYFNHSVLSGYRLQTTLSHQCITYCNEPVDKYGYHLWRFNENYYQVPVCLWRLMLPLEREVLLQQHKS